MVRHSTTLVGRKVNRIHGRDRRDQLRVSITFSRRFGSCPFFIFGFFRTLATFHSLTFDRRASRLKVTDLRKSEVHLFSVLALRHCVST